MHVCVSDCLSTCLLVCTAAPPVIAPYGITQLLRPLVRAQMRTKTLAPTCKQENGTNTAAGEGSKVTMENPHFEAADMEQIQSSYAHARV